MKKSLVLSLGLLTGLAGNTAFAKTGSIFLEGSITPETCPIEVVNPGDGGANDHISMGDIPVGRFTSANIEVRGASFDIRIPDKATCAIDKDNAFVKFDGDPDTSGDYFRVDPVADAAKNVSIVIRDRTTASIKPGETSVDYPLNATGPTDLRFDAYYRSTATGVTHGPASAKVSYTVDYR